MSKIVDITKAYCYCLVVQITDTHVGCLFCWGNMAVYYSEEIEKDALRTATGSTSNSLHDLRVLYYQSQTGLTTTSEYDLTRAFLLANTTGLTGIISNSDLWRAYLLGRGISNQVSLNDMLNDFYTGVGFGGGTAGTPMGIFPLQFTYAS